jgi:hypothetical protein
MSTAHQDENCLELTDAEGGRAVAFIYVAEGQLVINAQDGANLVIVHVGPAAAALLKRFAAQL